MKCRIGMIAKIIFLIVLLIMATSCGTTSNNPTSASHESINGMRLSLTLNSTTYQPGQEILIALDEKNMLFWTNYVKANDKLLYNNLRLLDNSRYPFGIAIFQGYYTSSNFSKATPLIVFDPSYIGMFSGNLISYSFKPLSDTASITVVPSTMFSNGDMRMMDKFSINGYWANYSPTPPNDFAPGVYTIRAGDEWGASIFLHFTITQ